ncbi:MAG: hypothetical protein RLZZ312_1996 [Bacteroidota bacterium]|jgi:predicted nucleotidyltransferase
MEFGLKQTTIDKINSVFEQNPEVEQVVIYGSRAMGNYRNGSDIDITLKGELLTHKILYKVIGEIDDLDTPYMFDISIFDSLNSPSLEDHISRVGKIFYENVV